jgi:hypothetical protein
LLDEGFSDLADWPESDAGAPESAAVFETEATVRVLLLKTASRFMK